MMCSGKCIVRMKNHAGKKSFGLLSFILAKTSSFPAKVSFQDKLLGPHMEFSLDIAEFKEF